MTTICRYFKEGRYCKFGDNCKFLHDRKEIKLYMSSPHISHVSSCTLCRNFEATGKCEYGDKCKFVHNTNKSGYMCKYFYKDQCPKGYCRDEHKDVPSGVKGFKNPIRCAIFPHDNSKDLYTRDGIHYFFSFTCTYNKSYSYY